MRKCIFGVTFFLFGFTNHATAKTNYYSERNVGICRGSQWCARFFPGVSVVKIETYKNEFLFGELQYGLAFPTILTVKTVGGIELNKVKVGMGLRLYPLAYGPQIELQTGKKKAITMSVELCQGYGGSYLGTITTIGFRGRNKNKQNHPFSQVIR